MGIYSGGTKIESLFLGGTDVQAVYSGAVQVWANAGLRDELTAEPGNGNFNIDISSLDIVTGDVGVLVIDSRTDDGSYTVTGWTQLANDDKQMVFVRSMIDTDTTITSVDADGLNNTVASVSIWNGVVLPTAIESSATLDPPPEVASSTEWFALAICGANNGTGGTVTAGPAGYTTVNNVSRLSGPGNTHNVWVDYKNIEGTTSEDPGPFTAGDVDDVTTYTLALVKG
jgi:hypothetical protein